MSGRPNIIVFLADDLGYSDLGCYGSEIRTPNLDRLAGAGVRLINFHNTPRCSPSRASLLTGLHPHQAGIGILADDDSRDGGYRGRLNERCVTIAEALRAGGYATAIRGKWHLSASTRQPDEAWPTHRGFDSFYGTLTGCGSFYWPGTLTRDTTNIEDEPLQDPDFFYTDRIADESIDFIRNQSQSDPDQPFFLYVPFTAPHWPLHARQDTIDSYKGVYDEGWDSIRAKRFARQRELGVISPETQLSPRDPSVHAWEDEQFPEWQAQRMQAYAAMVTEMDTAIGRVLDAVAEAGRTDDTVVIFLADNGASAEQLPFFDWETFLQRRDILPHFTRDGQPLRMFNNPQVVPGGEDTYASYGKGWANVSNTPYRLYKQWTHQGGIATPFIVHWPNGGLPEGTIVDNPFQLVDVMPTLLEITGAEYPSTRTGVPTQPLAGSSMLSALRGGPEGNAQLWWEHIGNAAIRRGRWKLVREHGFPWELYDIEQDPSELVDVAAHHPDLVTELAAEWQRLADEHGVIPYDDIIGIYRRRGLGADRARG